MCLIAFSQSNHCALLRQCCKFQMCDPEVANLTASLERQARHAAFCCYGTYKATFSCFHCSMNSGLTILVLCAFDQVEKAPLESYADVGGLEQQVQEIKEAVELPLTHPELYEDIGIKPPKVSGPFQQFPSTQILPTCHLFAQMAVQCALIPLLTTAIQASRFQSLTPCRWES